MRLVRGKEFREIIDEHRAGEQGWTLVRSIQVVQRICEAMAFAHEKGVVHRDLKPANVMVGRFGEVYVLAAAQLRSGNGREPRECGRAPTA
jgi:serine/threonine protein kinase